jgi:hypothetical protein
MIIEEEPMRSPFIIGLLSIIPGLGLFVLGKPKRGFWVIGILFTLLFIFLFIPGDFITQLSFQLILLVWVGQIVLAAQSARLQKRQEAGEVTHPREKEKIVPPPGLSLRERGDYKIRETVRQQLNPGENLLEAIFVQSGGGVGTYALYGALSALRMRQYYVGLTEESMVMIEQDNFGNHVDIKRIPLSDIKSIKLNKRILYDDLMINLGDKNLLKLQITSGLRRLTMSFYDKLQSNLAG